MSREKKEYKLTVVGGNRYPCLEAAQAAALKPPAEALVACIRRGLASGALVVSDGQVVLAEERDEP
jgi:hypothetical protein